MCTQKKVVPEYFWWSFITVVWKCVIPENIHTSPREGIFSMTLTTLWKFQSSFFHFLKFFGPYRTPTPQEIPIPSVGEYGYFLELYNDCLTLSWTFDISSQLKLNLGRKQRNKIIKINTNYDQISIHCHGLNFLSLNLMSN